MLDKGRLYTRLPNTQSGIVLNNGQLYPSIYAEDSAPVFTGVAMSIDNQLTLRVFGHIEIGDTVSLSPDGILTVKGLVYGSELSLSSSGILTVIAIEEGVV